VETPSFIAINGVKHKEEIFTTTHLILCMWMEYETKNSWCCFKRREDSQPLQFMWVLEIWY